MSLLLLMPGRPPLANSGKFAAKYDALMRCDGAIFASSLSLLGAFATPTNFNSLLRLFFGVWSKLVQVFRAMRPHG